ncbi:MAG: hypothetical protein NTU94_09525 [Planctomycetota bacterium]|nr:hypothetical protein [Planctomycetota bacterium]
MRRLSAVIGVVAILLGAVSAAKADIGAFAVSDQPAPSAPVTQAPAPLQAETGALDLGLSGAACIPTLASPEESADPLPPEPASLSLVLAGLGSLGAWQLGRAARTLHFGQVPEWFHTGGPVQIGHTYVANPDCSAVFEVCAFDQPVGKHPILHRMRCEPPLIFQPECILVTESPRGPPFPSWML